MHGQSNGQDDMKITTYTVVQQQTTDPNTMEINKTATLLNIKPLSYSERLDLAFNNVNAAHVILVSAQVLLVLTLGLWTLGLWTRA